MTPENTPIVGAEYLCAASVQKTKPMAEVTTAFARSNIEPRYKASLKRLFRTLRLCAGEMIVIGPSLTVL
jgi:hypothetical protein